MSSVDVYGDALYRTRLGGPVTRTLDVETYRGLGGAQEAAGGLGCFPSKMQGI